MSGNEADLCDTFIKALGPEWVVYPESCGWDILLSRHSDGAQIGVQAKMRPSMEVLVQAISPKLTEPGPDYHAVLLPDQTYVRKGREHRGLSGPWPQLATALNVWAIVLDEQQGYSTWPIDPDHDRDPKCARTGSLDAMSRDPKGWIWHHPTRHTLPEFVPRVRAGVPSPKQLTPWRISAIRLCIKLREQGHLTSDDFRAAGVDLQRWTLKAWLQPDGKIGRLTRYVAGPTPLPDADYPDIVAQMTATKPEPVPATEESRCDE